MARKRDGSLQMTMVSPVIGDDDRVTITACESTYKVKNIRRNPHVSFLVFGEKFNGSNYMEVDGKAEVRAHPQAIDIVLDWHRQIRGEPPNWDESARRPSLKGALQSVSPIEKVGPENRTGAEGKCCPEQTKRVASQNVDVTPCPNLILNLKPEL